MITTKLSDNEPPVPPMHHKPEDAADDLWLEERGNAPTPPMYGGLERTARNV